MAKAKTNDAATTPATPSTRTRTVKPLIIERISEAAPHEWIPAFEGNLFADEADALAWLKAADPGEYRIIQVRKTVIVKKVQATELEVK